MALINLNKTLKFKHFCGTLERWNTKKNSGEWDNAIVFGRIFVNNKWLYKIYAGKIANGDKDLYEYNFITADDFALIEERLRNVEQQLETTVDPSTGNTVFSDEDFNTALKNTINLLFSNDGKDLEQRLKVVEDSVLWVIKEEIEE